MSMCFGIDTPMGCIQSYKLRSYLLICTFKQILNVFIISMKKYFVGLLICRYIWSTLNAWLIKRNTVRYVYVW